jgi:hypothetical protein
VARVEDAARAAAVRLVQQPQHHVALAGLQVGVAWRCVSATARVAAGTRRRVCCKHTGAHRASLHTRWGRRLEELQYKTRHTIFYSEQVGVRECARCQRHSAALHSARGSPHPAAAAAAAAVCSTPRPTLSSTPMSRPSCWWQRQRCQRWV